MTLRQFLDKIDRYYGIEIGYADASRTAGRFLRKGSQLFPLPVMDEDEILPLDLLEFLCDWYRLPREDFGLMPRDDD